MTTDLKTFIDTAIKNSPAEASIVRKIVRACKRAGNPIVRVWDGEEFNAVSTERDVMEQVFNLDECKLYTQSGGWVYFVNGNEWDALSDYTVSLESIIDPVSDWAMEKGDAAAR